MNSLVVHNKLSTIAHEMFHWWNGRTIQTTPDANWIKKGFTTYYEGKILYAAGLWSEEKFSDYVDYLRMKLWRDREPTPIDLLEASKKLLVKKMEEEYDNVYFGGALVAHGLDQRLQEQGNSLDEIWKLLNSRGGAVTTEVFLQALGELGGAELARECESLVYGRRTIGLP